jgi:hypothetical protein
MATPQADTREQIDALSEILDGCATCCDGTLREAREVKTADNAVRLIEQARDLCRQAAQEVRGGAQR